MQVGIVYFNLLICRGNSTLNDLGSDNVTQKLIFHILLPLKRILPLYKAATITASQTTNIHDIVVQVL